MITRLQSKIYRLLKLSEKYFKTDMVYLVKGGSWLTLGQIVSTISGFTLAIAFANLLSAETYGSYKYILSILSLASITALPPMNAAVTRASAQNKDKTLIEGMMTKIKWGVLGSLGLLSIGIYYLIQDNTTLGITLLISAFFLPLFESFQIYQAFLQGKKRFSTNTKYFIVSKIIYSLLIVLTIFLTKSLIIIIAIYLLINTILPGYFFYQTYKQYKTQIKDSPSTDTSAYGKFLTSFSILSFIAGKIDNFLIFQYVGPANLAIYSFAKTPVNQLSSMSKNLRSLALPKFAEQSLEQTYKSITTKLKNMYLIVIIIIILYILLSPFIYKIFFPQYISSIFFSQLYVLTLLSAPINFVGEALKAHKRTKELAWLAMTLPVVKLGLLITLGYFYGIIGVIITFIGEAFITSIANLIVLQKIKKTF